MSKASIFSVSVALLGLAQVNAQVNAQETVKPLSGAELLKTIDSIGLGDPLLKQPLSVGVEKPTQSKSIGAADKKEKGPTEITARDLSMDNKTHKAIFTVDVVVKDPEFNVECDKLTAFLKHDDKADAKADPKTTVAKPDPKTPPAKGDADAKSGGLEKAIAESTGEKRVLITQDKVDADGTVSHNIGRAKKAVYDAVTGNITLTGLPSVQQGYNTCVALEESTVIILNRAGQMEVHGLHKSVLSNTSDKNKAR